MLIQTIELTGKALNWAAAKALYQDGREVVVANGLAQVESYPGSGIFARVDYDENWQQAKPFFDALLQGNGCVITHDPMYGEVRVEHVDRDGYKYKVTANDLAIAVLRCFVLSRMGDVVEIPPDIIPPRGHKP